MLYLHCGLRRTGTSSLQAVLAGHAGELERAGLIYPVRWRPSGFDAHYGLNELLEEAQAGPTKLDELRRYIGERATTDILLSSEALATWLPDQRRPALTRFLTVARDASPVTCIWVLRRADEILNSLYLHQIMYGYPVPEPEQYFYDNGQHLGEVVKGALDLERAVDCAWAYIKYERNGAHQEQILSVTGIPDGLRASLAGKFVTSSRLNAGLTVKAAIIMLYREQIAARAGIPMSAKALKDLFFRGRCRFASDEACNVVSGAVRRDIHGKVLASAREVGFDPYMEFFADEVPAAVDASTLDPDMIEEDDLVRLKEALAEYG